MLGAARQILGRIFPTKLFVHAIPLLAFIVGSLLLALAYLQFPASKFPVLHDVLKTLAQVILVGGVISVIMDSIRYLRIFQDAVYDVMYGSEYLKSRNDLIEVWRRVTVAICQEKFPELNEHLETGILETYLPRNKEFYYREYKRECVISWHDKEKGIVNVIDELDMYLIPISTDIEVFYSYNAWTDSRTSPDTSRVNVNYLTIEGITYENVLKEAQYDDSFGGKGLKQHYSIGLKGKPAYRILRSLTRKVRLGTDPVLEYSSKQFILGAQVKFRSQDLDLRPVFVSVGTEEEDFKNLLRPGLPSPWHVAMEFEGLLFPNQGYTLFIQHVAESDG